MNTHKDKGEGKKNRFIFLTADLANKALWKEIIRLGLHFPENIEFSYEREFDEDTMEMIEDFLIVIRSDCIYKTTMYPQKFFNLPDRAKIDFLNYIAQIDISYL